MLENRLKEYSKSGVYPFHMPGHKRQLDFPNPYSMDITEIEGFDNLHHAEGILGEAQQQAARLYGADRSYYLVNGSTCGILAAICAIVPKEARVLVARNCHKSVYHALELREAKPMYLYPAQTEVGIAGQIDARDVEALLRKEAGCDEAGESPCSTPKHGKRSLLSEWAECREAGLSAKQVHDSGESIPTGQADRIAAVILTSPTYDGVVSDIREIADIAHRFGVPLLVDAAHGAHLGFSDRFPENPLQLGADAVVVSVHKTLPAFTQTALLHLKGDRVSQDRVEEYLDIFETSSPSYVLMAGMERCIRMMASDGRRLLDKLANRLDAFYGRMAGLQRLYVLRGRDFCDSAYQQPPGVAPYSGSVRRDFCDGAHRQVYDFDESKILVFTDRARITGLQLADFLRTEYGLEIEMACANYVLALATLMDTDEGFQRLGDALLAIDAGLVAIEEHHIGRKDVAGGFFSAQGRSNDIISPPMQAMSLAQAREASRIPMPLEQACGAINASYLIPYPPGIPLVVPGERVDAQTIAAIRNCRRMGITIEGLMEKDTIMIVKSDEV